MAVILLASILGLIAGAAAVFLLQRPRIEAADADAAALAADIAAKSSEISMLNERLRAEAEIRGRSERAKEELLTQFKALSSDALRSNAQALLEMAKPTLEKFQEVAKVDLEKRHVAIDAMVKPIKESLARMDARFVELDKGQHEMFGSMSQEMKHVLDMAAKLDGTTGVLARALQAPHVRGRWGEMQLKNTVERVGMMEHVDFVLQESVTTEDGRLRPDMIVNLPGGARIPVDAKAPITAYLEAAECVEETDRNERLERHAAHIRGHVKALSDKAYWEQFQPAPEFVFMFLPGDCYYFAALQKDPGLIEFASSKRVVIATPSTLIALLWTVARAWKEEKMTKNALEVQELGRELYGRMGKLVEHFAKIGVALNQTVGAYNGTVASLESRVLPSVRKFPELGVSATDEIEELAKVDKEARPPALAIVGP